MSQLVETIRLEDGNPSLLHLHEDRMNRTRRELFGLRVPVMLTPCICPPENYRKGIVKCRVLYEKEIEKVEYETYTFRNIQSLQLIEGSNTEYHYKYANRSELLQLFSKRGNCDDILIVRNGYITDSSFANVVFLYGNRWITPDTPLLEGVRRRSYLETGIISAWPVRVNDLKNFSEARLINAMVSLEEAASVSINRIYGM